MLDNTRWDNLLLRLTGSLPHDFIGRLVATFEKKYGNQARENIMKALAVLER